MKLKIDNIQGKTVIRSSLDLLYNKNIFNLFSIQFYNTHLKN